MPSLKRRGRREEKNGAEPFGFRPEGRDSQSAIGKMRNAGMRKIIASTDGRDRRRRRHIRRGNLRQRGALHEDALR